MSAFALLQLALYFAVLTLLAAPLGRYLATVLQGETTHALRWLAPIERGVLGLIGPQCKQEMNWQQYAAAVLAFSALGFIALYALQRVQGLLPLNPQGLVAVSADSAFNTAVSFVTNTNWQGYAGESTMSYLTQMLGLTVQNFVSAAAGIAVLAALIRGLTQRHAVGLGNFWVDLTRVTLYVLLPLSFVLALALVSQGVIQNLQPAIAVPLLDATAATATATPDKDIADPTVQRLAQGPAASQVAIKQLGTNGGGFFNANSAHPYENPTPLSNLLQSLAILLIPAALCFAFGRMVRDPRQGWAIYAAMSAIFLVCAAAAISVEEHGHAQLAALGVDVAPGNLEGKETRFGVAASALWAVATTAASNGSVNAMHDSLNPLGGLVAMALMQTGEVVFGGVGSGLYGMLVFAIVAVFIAGLMVGRTPEYLGKKIEAFEMKMVALAILIPPLLVLSGTAIAVTLESGRSGISNPGAHGFSQVLYAFSSAGNNNGSAFAGLSANTPFYNTALGIAMWIARFWLMVPLLALAGSLAAKGHVAASAGTLPTHTPLFVALLIGAVIMVGALTFVPALALGPLVEHLALIGAAP